MAQIKKVLKKEYVLSNLSDTNISLSGEQYELLLRKALKISIGGAAILVVMANLLEDIGSRLRYNNMNIKEAMDEMSIIMQYFSLYEEVLPVVEEEAELESASSYAMKG